MKTKPIPLILLAGLVLAGDATARVFVATNSTWRYFKGTSEASSPTNAWRELAFDDSAWLTGPAPFHYGTNIVGGDDKLTGGTILTDMRSNYTCVFLRETFVIDDTNSVRGLWLNVWFDDGLGIWINGQPARNPVYVGGLAYTNTATTSHEANPLTRADISGAIAALRPGTNVLCLQAFNQSLTGDDFRIEAELAETPSSLAFASATITVSESGGQAVVRVIRSGNLNAGVTVDYATTNGTALAGQDYLATIGTLSFAAGETNQTIVLPILSDGLVETTEALMVTLSNPTGGAILGTPMSVTVSITDNDVGLQFQFASYSVAEEAGAVLVGIVRGDDGILPVTVDLATTGLTATSGLDFTGTTNTLSFAGAERFKLVAIPIFNDSVKEPNETFRVTLTNPTGATLGSQTTTTVTIVDNEQGFQFEAAGYTVAEDAGAVLIGVLRGSDATNSPMTVDYATTDGTATNDLDYLATHGTLAFAPGEKVKLVPVPILNDGSKEASKSFRVTLSNPSGGILGPQTNTTITILDNDPGLGFELSSYSVCEKAKAGEITLAVVRGNDGVLGPITVDYASADVTATAGTDYQAVSGTLAFQANETVKSLTVPILRPAPTGATKSFRVTLTNPTGGATLATATTTVSILENYPTLTPPVDASLAIRRERGVNVLTWTGSGQLQRADRVTGPWQTLTTARSPWPVQSPFPASFYRVDGTRPVNLYVPSSYDGQTPMPLVILLHALTATGQAAENWFGFRPSAEARGFLYCYPDGTINQWGYHYWNATDACCDFGDVGVDDTGYLRGVIEEIARRFTVDRKRVYLVGYSNGGFMSYRLACESADLIAGIVSVAGVTFLDSDRCHPSQPVNILNICGTADEFGIYGGGADTIGVILGASIPANMPPFPGVVKTVQIWADYNGSSGPITETAPSMDLDQNVPGLDTVITRYTNCPPGGAVELWTINGGGHVLTPSSQFSPRVIDWLLAHPKP